MAKAVLYCRDFGMICGAAFKIKNPGRVRPREPWTVCLCLALGS